MRRSPSPRAIPPPLEMECLKALWTIDEGTVHDVKQALAESRELAYTTVMTVLDRLEKRGAVSRRKHGRAFLYAPAVNRETMRERAVKELIGNFFEGSRDALLSYLRANVEESAKIETSISTTHGKI